MRPLLLALLAISGVLGPAAVAAASCAPPISVAEYAQRADAVVYGRAISYEGGPIGRPSRALVFEVQTVLKGSVPSRIVVQLGPGGDGGGAPIATSVDYAADPGSDHVLYLRQTAPAGFETDACSGSHAGAPTGDEAAFFGTGKAPDSAPILGVAAITLALRRAPAGSQRRPAV